MAKFSFKVYLENGSSSIVKLSDMTSTELHDMDKFVEKCDGIYNLYNILANELGIQSSLIKKVTIFQNRNGNEFSLVSNNEYLVPVLNDLQLKKIRGDRKYILETMTVSISNPQYVAMKEYLFDKIRTNYKLFLTEIYPYNNELSRLINKYGVLYNQGAYNDDDNNELNHLKNLINLELSVYKNYRGLCRSRKKYEELERYQFTRRRNANNIQVNTPVITKQNYSLQDEMPAIKELTEVYNQEYEEFLDEDEYRSMADGNEVFKGHK